LHDRIALIGNVVFSRPERYAMMARTTSLPGLSRQSIILQKTLAKKDGYAGQARV
jgi:hypothetical protein